MRYDVVIIGSGLGGLVCASLLAKAGKHVVVVERHRQPGGCLQGYRRQGLSFDTGFHYVGGLGEGQRLQRVFSSLGLMRLPWQRLDADGFDRVTIGGQTFRLAEGHERFVDTLACDFPAERAALQRYVSMVQQVEATSMTPYDMCRQFGQSAYGYLTSTFRDPLLINVLSGTALTMELQRQSLPLFVFAHAGGGCIAGAWRLRGCGHLLAETLATSIRQAGGDIVCGTEAVELLERDGLIEALRCSNGETYQGQVFISDIHPAHTFAILRESRLLKGIFWRRISSIENTMGMFTASLVLKPRMLRYFNHNKFVYLKPNVWSPPLSLCQPGERTADVDRVMVSCRVPTDGTDDARQIDLLTPMPWSCCERWADTQVEHRGEEYADMKHRMAEACITLAEREIPGLSSMIQEQYTSTPLTWRDYTQTPYGSAYGIRKDCNNLMLTMLSPRTPIPNLMLTGQNLMLHGVEGVTMTALKTCEAIIDNVQSIIDS